MGSRTATDSTLTDQQDLFCREYLKDLNATQAATRAKYSENTASEQGSRLLSNVKIQERIQTLMHQRTKRLEISADTVLRELLLIAKSDISEAFDDKGNLLPIKQIPKRARRAIAGIETEELFEGYGRDKVHIGQSRKVKLWDKPRALEMLARHVKLFSDKLELEHAIDITYKTEWGSAAETPTNKATDDSDS